MNIPLEAGCLQTLDLGELTHDKVSAMKAQPFN